MLTDVKTHEINGTTYIIQPLVPKTGRKVLMRLIRLFGPAFEAIEKGDPIATLTKALTDDEVDFLTDAFIDSTRLQKGGGEVPLKGQFDNHFAANYGEMMLWLWACINTNFGSFLEGLGVTPEVLNKLKTGVQTELTHSFGAQSSPATAPSTK
jgi:hypothetical protein